MAACGHLSDCPFFNDRMANMPLVSEILKEQYCLSEMSRCARYRVYRSGLPVPNDLFPDDQDRCLSILES